MDTLPLADRLLNLLSGQGHNNPYLTRIEARRGGEHVRQMLMSAQRYYLDQSVTDAALALVTDAPPELLSAMLADIRLPFPRMWVEWPMAEGLWMATRLRGLQPERGGAFLERLGGTQFRITPVAQSAEPTDPFEYMHIRTLPICVVFDTAQQIEHAPEFAAGQEAAAKLIELPVDDLRISTLGAANPHSNGVTEPELEVHIQYDRGVMSHAAYQMTPVIGELVETERRRHLRGGEHPLPDGRTGKDIMYHANRQATSTGGFAPFLIAVLALMNQRSYIEADSTARYPGPRMTGNRRNAYLSHRLATLRLPRTVVVQEVRDRYMPSVASRPAWMVEGHWSYSRKRFPPQPGCQHEFAAISATRPTQACIHCGHRRWHQPEHQRGDASVGFMLRDRRVTGRSLTE